MKMQTEYIIYLFARRVFGYDKHPFQCCLSHYRHCICGVSGFGRLCWISYQRVICWSGMVLLRHVFSYTFLESRITVLCVKILKYYCIYIYIYIYMHACIFICIQVYVYKQVYILYMYAYTQIWMCKIYMYLVRSENKFR